MPDMKETFSEIAKVENYIRQGYRVENYKEDLYGAHVMWGNDKKQVEPMDIFTPECRKFITTYMFTTLQDDASVTIEEGIG